MTREQIVKKVYEYKLIVIVRGLEKQECVSLANALYKGGIRMMEVTFDQSSNDHYAKTLEAIQAVKEQFEDQMYVGAGTVLSKEQVDLAIKAGASYIVTPTTNVEVIQYAKSQGLATLPGALSPTEAVNAYEAGADFVKIFPIGNLGSGYLKAIKAPLKHIPMLAVGGVDEENIVEFLKAGAVGAGVGGKLVNKEWIKNGEFNKITELAKKYVSNIQTVQ